MTDEYDSWRRYEDAKAFKNKLAEIDQLRAEINMLKNRIEKLEAALRTIYKCCDETGNCSVVRRIASKALETDNARP